MAHTIRQVTETIIPRDEDAREGLRHALHDAVRVAKAITPRLAPIELEIVACERTVGGSRLTICSSFGRRGPSTP